MLLTPTFVPETSEESIAEYVDFVKKSPEMRENLVPLLSESLPIYKGRSTNETIRIRGYVLAAFEQVGLPMTALPYVLEELESGIDAYTIAGAAKAVRGMSDPLSGLVPYLLKAVTNVKYHDDALSFDEYKPQWPRPTFTTALTEVFRTLAWLGNKAIEALPTLDEFYANPIDFAPHIKKEIQAAIDAIHAAEVTSSGCCDGGIILTPTIDSAISPIPNTTSIKNIILEDQNRATSTFGDFFRHTPTLVAFFYTRCNNPNKCSLTITKLAHLQKAIHTEGLDGQLKTAAITYDPGYDLPSRLKAYGENRGIIFNDNHRFFRTLSSFETLQTFFGLGVNFNGSIVNRHRIELFILDAHGNIVVTFSRLQWEVDAVMKAAKSVIDGDILKQEVTISQDLSSCSCCTE
jgi:protein SCO1/2